MEAGVSMYIVERDHGQAGPHVIRLPVSLKGNIFCTWSLIKLNSCVYCDPLLIEAHVVYSITWLKHVE